ncbi:hypothetical protein [Pedobacter foliorum]|uniref:hypothetical protein n=1 Tax=Pedobacter foliorum TaxID=2739058 RepID=UPI001FEC6E8D|nr:hypothetical protein [Pedobacter foliorum]
MKSLLLNMYKKINYIAAVLLLLTSISVNAQVTTQSPYSRFGLGNVKGALLPQFKAMGGISTGVYKPSGFSNINMQNPATYSGITLTTLDMGLSGAVTTLKDGSKSESSFNGTLSHVAVAFPIVAGKSAISFGLLPFTELGYEYTVNDRLDTNNVNYNYSGEGNLTKAYFGYGQQFGDHFRIGGNIEYIFGNLLESATLDPLNQVAFNSRNIKKNSVGGVGFSYGAQYEIPLGTKKRITLGYSGSSSSSINSQKTFLTTLFKVDSQGEGTPDTVKIDQNSSAKLKLPLMHNFGISIQRDNKWMIGADYRMGKWSKLSLDGLNQGLQDSWGFSGGGQFTPDAGATTGYFKHVDYRMGFQYDKTYIRLNDQDVKQMAVTFGLGLPLALSRNSIYKLNFTTEVGKRGSITNGLIQENYINFHLGFTLNDTWFRRYKFD